MSLKLIFFLVVFFPFTIQKLNYSEYISNKNMTKYIIRNLLQEEDSSSLNNFDLIREIAIIVFEYIEKNDLSLIYSENFAKCLYSGILEHLNGGEMIETCVLASGKTMNDFGNEFECDSTFQSESKYITLHFVILNFEIISKDDDILKFLENYHSYIGLCIPKKCVNAIKEFVEHQPLLDIIKNEIHIADFKVNIIKEIEKEYDSEGINSIYEFILLFYIFFNSGKVIIGIFRLVWMNKGYKQYYVSKLNKGKRGTIASISESKDEKNEGEKIDKEEEKGNKEDEKDDKNGKKDRSEFSEDLNQSSLINMKFNDKEDLFSFYNRSINATFTTDEINLYNPFVDIEKEFPLWLKILKSLDFFDNVNILCELSNRYYNSFQIRRLYILRFGLMIMCIVHQIVYSQLDLPYRYYMKNDFYKRFLFTIVKFCVNSSTFWITLDAVFIGYKMMCFMKKEIKLSGNIKFLGLAKFLLLIIPKFILFFLAFVLLNIFSDNLTFEICRRNKVLSPYLYYKDTIYNRTYDIRQTENNFWNLYKNFIPFKLNYIDFIKEEKFERKYNITDKDKYNMSFFEENKNISNITEQTIIESSIGIPSPFLTNTELFVNVYFNEFYLLIIMIVITYFSYILRNKIFDYIILGINIFLYFLPLLDESINKHIQDKKDLKYTLRYVLGQYYTEKYTHFFINFFYFGFLIGVMKFYLDENFFNQKKRKEEKEDLKLGYEFCQKIIISLNKIKLRYKRIILLLSILSIFLISSSFFFLMLKLDSDFDIDMTNSLYYLFIYEKNFCGIFFFIFLIMFILYPKNTNIMQLSETNGFIILERISCCFFCSFKFLIYSQFCVFIIYIKISYTNLLLNTLGMFLIIFGFSLITTTLIELPLRQLIKSLMNKDFEKKFETYYNKKKEKLEENSLNNNIRTI
jgi:hypothetical protein